ncbi:hypothetical protein ANN_24397 [Periplaneta americana]|uniref:Uncharacterized protein n=1 Tax=Periplaneta americana TaxID=6978 RepID=A0ABQ8S322_PERAM|nr:hypothetical protein ANN_24397 [Periplaneta americana]
MAWFCSRLPASFLGYAGLNCSVRSSSLFGAVFAPGAGHWNSCLPSSPTLGAICGWLSLLSSHVGRHLRETPEKPERDNLFQPGFQSGSAIFTVRHANHRWTISFPDVQVRRIDIIAIKNNSAYILDPTTRFEIHADQPHEVDSEKKRIYEPTVPFYKDKYSLSHIDVIDLMVGARGLFTKNDFQSDNGTYAVKCCDWPARSPDLTPLVFFVWDFMKEKVYATEITDRDHLLQRISAAATDIRLRNGLLVLVHSAVKERTQACSRANGVHFEQLLE